MSSSARNALTQILFLALTYQFTVEALHLICATVLA